MRIGLHIGCSLPVKRYGGTERVVWSLAKALHRAGHEVTLIAGKGTAADFARVVELRPGMSVWAQIPDNLDIIHFQNALPPLPAAAYADGISRALTGKRDIPYVVTVHGNIPGGRLPDPNAIFVSEAEASR